MTAYLLNKSADTRHKSINASNRRCCQDQLLEKRDIPGRKNRRRSSNVCCHFGVGLYVIDLKSKVIKWYLFDKTFQMCFIREIVAQLPKTCNDRQNLQVLRRRYNVYALIPTLDCLLSTSNPKCFSDFCLTLHSQCVSLKMYRRSALSLAAPIRATHLMKLKNTIAKAGGWYQNWCRTHPPAPAETYICNRTSDGQGKPFASDMILMFASDKLAKPEKTPFFENHLWRRHDIRT